MIIWAIAFGMGIIGATLHDFRQWDKPATAMTPVFTGIQVGIATALILWGWFA